MGKIIYKPVVEEKAPETTAPETTTTALQTKSCATAAKEAHITDCFNSILHDNVQTARFQRNAWFVLMIVAVIMLIIWVRKAIA